MASSAAISSSDEDDDSDDEYLTLQSDSTSRTGTASGNVVDREALVRKKLLENFYGKSAATAASNDRQNQSSRRLPSDSFDDSESEDSGVMMSSSKESNNSHKDKSNLDSPAFDASAYVHRHIQHSSLHVLLETDEQLALQCRTLDSTMQTMVYENYTRFIDATDAIRSIGVNVTANEQGLATLTPTLQRLDQNSKSLEDAVGTLRDQVAEKIRVQRLLQRLDTLLKLPQTLRAEIAAGKYRAATRNYLATAALLSQHSARFESLRSIELECQDILRNMQVMLRRKLLHWSGSYHHQEDDDGGCSSTATPSPPEPPPRNMAEIMECAGTLHMLRESRGGDPSNINDDMMITDDLQGMAMTACSRALDRVLDAHMIRVQEGLFVMMHAGSERSSVEDLLAQPEATTHVPDEQISVLVPRDYLQALLESATLFASTFRGTVESETYLLDFVAESFANFLSHVRTIVTDEGGIYQVGDEKNGHSDRNDNTDYDEGNGVRNAVAHALIVLSNSVRELAAALTLPEVGVSASFASQLVSQALSLQESILRRRVATEFLELRATVARECLLPLAQRMIQHKNSDAVYPDAATTTMLDITIASANIALSDSLQLVDDVIRSVFASVAPNDGSAATDDLAVVKYALEQNMVDFTVWLARSMESMACGLSCNAESVLTAPSFSTLSADGHEHKIPSGDARTVAKLVDSAEVNQAMLAVRDELANIGSRDVVLLAMVECCRTASRSVQDSLGQSIAVHLGGGGRKRSHGLFPSDRNETTAANRLAETAVAQEFSRASKRMLILYATDKATQATELAVSNMLSIADIEELTPALEPQKEFIGALEKLKAFADDVGAILSGPKAAGPLPKTLPDAKNMYTAGLGSKKSGLSLDIERMFKDKVFILPQISDDLEISVRSMLNIALKSFVAGFREHVRQHQFTVAAFQQLQVDIEFLKAIVPHYVSHEADRTALTNLLADVIDAVGERCDVDGCNDDDELLQNARYHAEAFLDKLHNEAGEISFVIRDV